MNTGWVCPLSGEAGCSKLHAIGTDGGLKHYLSINQADLGKQGWLHVDFPLRNYYFEHDITHPSYRQRDTLSFGGGIQTLDVDAL